jgi:putative redox protein
MRTTAKLMLDTVEAPGIRFRAGSDDPSLPTILLDSGQGAIAPSPVVAFLASLGACGGMDVIGILRKKRQDVTGYEIEVVGERREEHPRAVTSIEVIHRVRGRNLSPQAVEEAIRLADTKYCSVHATLEHAVPIQSRYEIVPEDEAGR